MVLFLLQKLYYIIQKLGSYQLIVHNIRNTLKIFKIKRLSKCQMGIY